MRTTVTVRDEVMKDLMRITEAQTQTEAVNRAVADWVRRMKVLKIKSMRGRLHIEGNVGKLRRLELKEPGAGDE